MQDAKTLIHDRDTCHMYTRRCGNDGGFAPSPDTTAKCNAPDYNDLRNAMEGIELGDGDSWI